MPDGKIEDHDVAGFGAISGQLGQHMINHLVAIISTQEADSRALRHVRAPALLLVARIELWEVAQLQVPHLK